MLSRNPSEDLGGRPSIFSPEKINQSQKQSSPEPFIAEENYPYLSQSQSFYEVKILFFSYQPPPLLSEMPNRIIVERWKETIYHGSDRYIDKFRVDINLYQTLH